MARLNIGPYLRQAGAGVESATSSFAKALDTAHYQSELNTGKIEFENLFLEYYNQKKDELFGNEEKGIKPVEAVKQEDLYADADKKIEEYLQGISKKYTNWRAAEDIGSYAKARAIDLKGKIQELYQTKIIDRIQEQYLKNLDTILQGYTEGSFEEKSEEILKTASDLVKTGGATPDWAHSHAMQAIDEMKKIEASYFDKNTKSNLNNIRNGAVSLEDGIAIFNGELEKKVKIGVIPAGNKKSILSEFEELATNYNVIRIAEGMTINEDGTINTANIKLAGDFVMKNAVGDKDSVFRAFSSTMGIRIENQNIAFNAQDKKESERVQGIIQAFSGLPADIQYKALDLIKQTILGNKIDKTSIDWLSAALNTASGDGKLVSQSGLQQLYRIVNGDDSAISFHNGSLVFEFVNKIEAEQGEAFKALISQQKADADSIEHNLQIKNAYPNEYSSGNKAVLESAKTYIIKMIADNKITDSESLNKLYVTLDKIEKGLYSIQQNALKWADTYISTAETSGKIGDWSFALGFLDNIIVDPNYSSTIREEALKKRTIVLAKYDKAAEEEYKKYLTSDAEAIEQTAIDFYLSRWDTSDSDKINTLTYHNVISIRQEILGYIDVLKNRKQLYAGDEKAQETIEKAIRNGESYISDIEDYALSMLKTGFNKYFYAGDIGGMESINNILSSDALTFKNKRAEAVTFYGEVLEKIYGTEEAGKKLEALQKKQEYSDTKSGFLAKTNEFKFYVDDYLNKNGNAIPTEELSKASDMMQKLLKEIDSNNILTEEDKSEIKLKLLAAITPMYPAMRTHAKSNIEASVKEYKSKIVDFMNNSDETKIQDKLPEFEKELAIILDKINQNQYLNSEDKADMKLALAEALTPIYKDNKELIKKKMAEMEKQGSNNLYQILKAPITEAHFILNTILPLGENGVLSDEEKSKIRKSINTAKMAKDVAAYLFPDALPADYVPEIKDIKGYYAKNSASDENPITTIETMLKAGYTPFSKSELQEYIAQIDNVISSGVKLLATSERNYNSGIEADRKTQIANERLEEGKKYILLAAIGAKDSKGNAITFDKAKDWIELNKDYLPEGGATELRSMVSKLETDFKERTKPHIEYLNTVLNDKSFEKKFNGNVSALIQAKEEYRKKLAEKLFLEPDVKKWGDITQSMVDEINKNLGGTVPTTAPTIKEIYQGSFTNDGRKTLTDVINGRYSPDNLNFDNTMGSLQHATILAVAKFLGVSPEEINNGNATITKIRMNYNNITSVNNNVIDAGSKDITGNFPAVTYKNKTYILLTESYGKVGFDGKYEFIGAPRIYLANPIKNSDNTTIYNVSNIEYAEIDDFNTLQARLIAQERKVMSKGTFTQFGFDKYGVGTIYQISPNEGFKKLDDKSSLSFYKDLFKALKGYHTANNSDSIAGYYLNNAYNLIAKNAVVAYKDKDGNLKSIPLGDAANVKKVLGETTWENISDYIKTQLVSWYKLAKDYNDTAKKVLADRQVNVSIFD